MKASTQFRLSSRDLNIVIDRVRDKNTKIDPVPYVINSNRLKCIVLIHFVIHLLNIVHMLIK